MLCGGAATLCGSAVVLTVVACDLCDGADGLRVDKGRFCGVQRVRRVENFELQVEDAALREVQSVRRAGPDSRLRGAECGNGVE